MTAHLRFVNYSVPISNGDQFVDIAPGWEVAPANDPNVLRVCGAHAWQAHQLVLADGGLCNNKFHPPAGNLPARARLSHSVTSLANAGKHTAGTNLKREGAKVAATNPYYDVLLRRRA
jgi:hypothetical protein